MTNLPIEPASAPAMASGGDRFYRHVLVLALLAILGVVLYSLVRPFFSSLVWALLLGFLLSPLNRRLRQTYRGSRGWAALSVTLLVLFGLAIPTALLAAKFVAQGIELVQSLSKLYATGGHLELPWLVRAGSFIEHRLPVQVEPAYAYVTSKLSNVLNGVATLLLGIATGVISGVVSLAVTLVILFFLLRDGDGLGKRLLAFVPLRAKDRQELIERTAAVTRATVLGSLITAMLQGALIGIAFAVVGLPSPVVFGVIAGFLSLLPVVGTGCVWVPAAAALTLQGRWGAALFLAIWGLFVVGLVDNIIRPLFVSGKAELPTLAVLLGVLGGISAFGFVGTFLGPVIFSVALALLRLAPPPAEH